MGVSERERARTDVVRTNDDDDDSLYFWARAGNDGHVCVHTRMRVRMHTHTHTHFLTLSLSHATVAQSVLRQALPAAKGFPAKVSILRLRKRRRYKTCSRDVMRFLPTEIMFSSVPSHRGRGTTTCVCVSVSLCQRPTLYTCFHVNVYTYACVCTCMCVYAHALCR